MITTEDKISAFLAQRASRSADHANYLLSHCESPIERLFLAALLASGAGSACDLGIQETVAMLRDAGVDAPAKSGPYGVWRFGVFVLQPQLRGDAGLWRPDFGFVHLGPSPMMLRLAVELDGHDFHERTKEQAKRDKSRDRDLNRLGWRVLRFTGSEVFGDAERCVDELSTTIDALLFPEVETS